MKRRLIVLVLLFASLTGHTAAPPPADEVFQVQVKTLDPNTFIVNWQIKPGFFLYSDRIKLDLQPESNFHLGTLRFPSPLIKVDQQGHSYTVYRDTLRLPIPVLGENPGESLLQLQYQGCADDGFCYPPETRWIKVTIDAQKILAGVSLEKDHEEKAAPASKEPVNDAEAVFENHHWAMILLSFFGFGLLLAFTPCVLPMVPVLSGIIVGHRQTMSTRRAFLLSLSYVLGMSLTYAIVGAVVALLGNNLQIAMQSPIVIALFCMLFVLLSLSMFGFFELKLPISWQAKLAKVSQSQANGHYIGAALMGCLSTLILSPCVTAPLLGALSYIAHTGNIFLGSFALFFLGLGMGAPLLLLGASAGRWLPKAGQWMNTVKSFFGVMLLAVAIFLSQRIAPASLVMALWAALLVFSGVFIGAFNPAQSHRDKFNQALGILLVVYGLLVLIGASMGETNPFRPLAGLNYPQSQHSPATKQTIINPLKVQEAINKAKGKPIMLDFYADWCTACKIMEATTFKDPSVIAQLKDFVILKIDVTANNKAIKALLRKYNVVAPPTFVFFNEQGQELTKNRVVGELSASAFLKKLKQIANPGSDS